MKKSIPAIKTIKQIDNHSFKIEWSDGIANNYKLSDLQRLCPCAGCVDEESGRRLKPAQAIDDSVRAINIQSVGRYALKIRFTSGCSTGIYSFQMLRDMR
jgi:DUF971 family protein